MRKTLIAAIIILILWIAYLVWPMLALYSLARAIETREVPAVTRTVDFSAVRNSVVQQVVAAYTRRAGIKVDPLAATVLTASSIADPIADKLISPEAIATLLQTGWPSSVLPERPAGLNVSGISRANLGTAWQLFANSDYGIGRFTVSAPASFPPDQRFGLTFRLAQWRWQVTGIGLPANVLNALADELIKRTRPPMDR